MSCVPPISLRPAALFRLPTIVIAIGAAMMPATAAEPTTQELAAKLRETLTGLHTVEMQYRETQNFEGRTTSNEHEWLRSGEKIRLIIHEGDLPGDWCSFDGRFGYNVDYFPDRPLDIRNINKTTTTPGGLARNMPGNWLGLRLQELPSRDLADLLEQPEARIIATETFDGMPAYRVDLGEHQTQQGAFVWTTVICPERDGLPVEISREPAESNPDGERLRNLVGPVRLFVTAFYEVHDAALQRTRWAASTDAARDETRDSRPGDVVEPRQP